MRSLLEDIIAKVRTDLPQFKFVGIYNQQEEEMKAEKNQYYDVQKPALFIEVIDDTVIQQLGGGLQIYDPLLIRLHVVHEQFDAIDGTMEQNLDVYDLKQDVYLAFDRWEPNGSSMWVRMSEKRDHNHTNIYVFLQDWQTTFVDNSAKRPSAVTTPPTNLQIDI